MKRRGLITFMLINIVLTGLVAFAIISLFSNDDDGAQEILVTFEVIITATPDPNVTPNVIMITPTPDQSQPERANIPDSVREGTPLSPEQSAALAQAETSEDEGIIEDESPAVPENCIEHVIASGEYPSLIAVNYGVDMFTLLAVNNLDEERSTQLQVGDVLIIPLEGCPVDQFIQQTPEDTTGVAVPEVPQQQASSASALSGRTNPDGQPMTTPERTVEPARAPTLTLPPTATNAQVEIVQVMGVGDITTEAVEIRNSGNTIDIGGWSLSNGEGSTFVFPGTQRLFSGGSVTINTRVGDNTAIMYYWGRDEAVFQPGGVVTLSDRNANVQASLRLPN